MMNTGRDETDAVRHLHLLDELQELLNEQMATVRRGDFSASEELAEKSSRIVDQLAQTGAWQEPGITDRRERLVKSYRTIILSVAAEKNRVERQILRIAQGRKTLRAYHG